MPGGRPHKKPQIPKEKIGELAGIGCTDQEIAAICGFSVDTLHRNYAELMATGKQSGKTRLRKMQWAAAQKGNSRMLVWLGKQYLDQIDRKELSGPNGGAIPIQLVNHIDRPARDG